MLEATLSGSEGAAPGLRARALWGAGFLIMMTGEPNRAAPMLEQSLAAFRELEDLQGAARALLILGNCNQSREGGIVLPLIQESAALAREAGDGWCLAHALGVAGFTNISCGEFAVARGLFEKCLSVARKAQDKQGLRFGLIGLGSVAVYQGDYRLAQKLLEEGLAVAGELGEGFSEGEALRWLATLALGRGDYARASELLEESLTLLPEVAPREAAFATPMLLGRVAHAAGDRSGALRRFDEAAIHGGDAAAWALPWRGDVVIDEGDFDEGRRLFERALAQARAGGQKHSIAQALHGLGRHARRVGDFGASTRHHKEALELQREIGAAPDIVASLEALAGLAAAARRCHHAARLLGAASRHRQENGYARLPWESVVYEADLASVRAGLQSGDFEEACTEGEKLSLEDAMVVALNGGARRGRPPHESASLTEHEQLIAQLAAEGLTNREIAERMVIAQATVKYHLAHIFSKLGVSRRGELARALWRPGGDAGVGGSTGHGAVSHPST